MIEIGINKIVNWKTIEHIKNLAKKDVVIVRMPKSIYNHKKMKYKIEILKGIPTVVINIEEKQKGRKKKVNDFTKEKIFEMIKEGYSVREIGKELGISKSTVWHYAKDYIKEMKKEYLKKLIWELKETAVEEGWYDHTVQALFLELEAHIKNNDLEKSKEILQKIIEYRHEAIE